MGRVPSGRGPMPLIRGGSGNGPHPPPGGPANSGCQAQDLAVELPTKYDLYVNVKTATAFAKQWERRQACQIVGMLPDRQEEAEAVLRRALFLLQSWRLGNDGDAGSVQHIKAETRSLNGPKVQSRQFVAIEMPDGPACGGPGPGPSRAGAFCSVLKAARIPGLRL